jgi:hypothetical protein
VAFTELYTGTQDLAAADGEWSLTTDTAGPDADTTDGLIQAVIDLADLADGEEIQVRAYEKARSGDTQRKVWEVVYSDGLSTPLIYTPPMILMHGWDFTIDTVTGTVTVNWSIRSLAQTVTERVSGSEAISTTEWSLATDSSYDTGDAQTTDGLYQVFLDVNDMVQADELQIRAYEKARSGDTQQIAYQSYLYGPQANPLWVGPALAGYHGWDWTLDALAGTITVNWSVRTVGS